ncbi:endonuclease/exonuclease/phosphatase family protein [Celeribacter marinus]|uniref:endonuclease/exonuclease/phosphatase family protein n=1 Tax=Celeribacter marinus TaxID=1397108 RepID=UPI003F6ABE4E
MRIAFWDVGLTRNGPGLLLKDIIERDADDIAAARDHILYIAPDILLIAGFDTDFDGYTAKAFADFLDDGYTYTFSTVGNVGIPSGFDLDRDGRLGEQEDAWAYGDFRGQGGLALLSKMPIVTDDVRTFTDLLWADAPQSRFPYDYFTPDESKLHPLSSNGHWVVPIRWGDTRLDLLAFKAATPVFDGPEDRNGRRNADEIALWRHYLDGTLSVGPSSSFVILGNANLDPVDGEGLHGEIIALLNHKDIQDPLPTSDHGAQISNPLHHGDPRGDTADWRDPNPGNLRVDYVLPSADLSIVQSALAWVEGDHSSLFSHAMVWVDIAPLP